MHGVHYTWVALGLLLGALVACAWAEQADTGSSPTPVAAASTRPIPSATAATSMQASKRSAMYTDSEGRHVYSQEFQATRVVDGVTYTYSNKRGQETIRVKGKVPEEFDYEEILRSFRQLVGANSDDATKAGGTAETTADGKQRPRNRGTGINKEDSNGQGHGDDKSGHTDTGTPEKAGARDKGSLSETDDSLGSLYEQVSTFFGASGDFSAPLLDQHELDTRRLIVEADKKRHEEELERVKNDLHEILTEYEILRKRQAELGRWLRDHHNEGMEAYPNVKELVETEGERLHLLEHRLKKMRLKLRTRKAYLLAVIERTRDQLRQLDNGT